MGEEVSQVAQEGLANQESQNQYSDLVLLLVAEEDLVAVLNQYSEERTWSLEVRYQVLNQDAKGQLWDLVVWY